MMDFKDNIKILLVDDSAEQLAANKLVLEHAGFRKIDCCYTGQETLDYMLSNEKNLPAIIVSDVIMPGMDGLELCRKLRQLYQKEIAIVLFTMQNDENMIKNALISGADDFLEKPITPAKLISRVSGVLASHNKRSLDKRIFEFIPAAIRIVNLNFEVIKVNKAFEKLAQVNRNEIIGKSCYMTLACNECDTKNCKFEQVKQTNEMIERETTITLPDGISKKLHVMAVPLLGINNQFEGIIEIFCDSIIPKKPPEHIINENPIAATRKTDSQHEINFLDENFYEEVSDKLNKSLIDSLYLTAKTVEYRDPYIKGHSKNIAKLACTIAEKLNIGIEKIEALFVAAILHDIGKIAIPREILIKPEPLSKEELKVVYTHSEIGYELVKYLDLPPSVPDIILQHHERIDGSGYPFGKKGEELLIESKILAVADVVEAMSHSRADRKALDFEIIIEELKKNKGTKYDSEIVDICLTLFNQENYNLDAE